MLAFSKQNDVKAADLAEDLYGSRESAPISRIRAHIQRLLLAGKLERTGHACYRPTGSA